MSGAGRSSLASLRSAAASFLRGFTGISADGRRDTTDPGDGHDHHAAARPTPAEARAALAARAARRPSCC